MVLVRPACVDSRPKRKLHDELNEALEEDTPAVVKESVVLG